MKQIAKREVNYVISIPAEVCFDLHLSANEKLLYGELYTLGGMEKNLTVTNQYLASLYHVTVRSISAWLIKLSECGYLTIVTDPNSKKRVIDLTKLKGRLGADGYLYEETLSQGVSEPESNYINCSPSNAKTDIEETDLIAERNRFVDSEVARIFDDMEKHGAEPPVSIKDDIIAELTRGAIEKFNHLHGIEVPQKNSLGENFKPRDFSPEEDFRVEDNLQSEENDDETGMEENFQDDSKKNISSLENNFHSSKEENKANCRIKLATWQ